MDADDFIEPEVAAAAAATAAALSPKVRNLLHQGAVYGVTGALLAGDALTAFGRGVSRGLRSATGEAGGSAGELPPRQEPASEPETGGATGGYIIEEEEG